MEAAHAGRDLPTYYRINRLIHDRLNALAGNAVLEQTYRTLNARLHALRFRSNLNPAKWDLAVAEHRAMIEALAARDGAALRDLLVGHLRAKQQAVLDSMKNRDDKNLQGGKVP
jgi:DNA-binding GntR family transcriptional regulator